MLKELDQLIKGRKLEEARAILDKLRSSCSEPEFLLAQAAVDFASSNSLAGESKLLLADTLPSRDWRIPLALTRHYIQVGNQERARLFAKRAYEHKSDEPSVLLAYMHTLLDISDYREVLALFKKHKAVIKLNRSFLLVGISAFRAAGRFDEALALISKFLQTHVDDRVGLRLLADIHADRDSTTGLEKYKKVIARQEKKYGKKDVATCWNASLHFLRHREFREGWSYWEMGFGREVGTMARKLPEQLGKVHRVAAADQIDPDRWLFIVPEQGIGDQVLFLSSLNDLMKESRRLVLVSDPRLSPLLKRSFPDLPQVSPGIIDALPEARGLPNQGYMPYGSIPAKYRPSVESFLIHRRPFLRFDEVSKNKVYQRFRARADGRPIIGISWKGGFWESQKKNKGLDLAAWIEALRSVDAQYICLQYGDVSDAEQLFKNHQIRCSFLQRVDFTKDIEGWLQCIQACDGVFSVSTALVHFSSALGVPTKIVMPKPYGPWILGIDDTSHIAYDNCEIARLKHSEQAIPFITSELESFHAKLLRFKG